MSHKERVIYLEQAGVLKYKGLAKSSFMQTVFRNPLKTVLGVSAAMMSIGLGFFLILDAPAFTMFLATPAMFSISKGAREWIELIKKAAEDVKELGADNVTLTQGAFTFSYFTRKTTSKTEINGDPSLLEQLPPEFRKRLNL